MNNNHGSRFPCFLKSNHLQSVTRLSFGNKNVSVSLWKATNPGNHTKDTGMSKGAQHQPTQRQEHPHKQTNMRRGGSMVAWQPGVDSTVCCCLLLFASASLTHTFSPYHTKRRSE